MGRRSRFAVRLTATLMAGTLAATAGGTVLASAAGATATWPTYHNDNSRDGIDPSEASLDPATRAWSANLGAAVYGQPVVADGRIFVGTEGDRVVALNPRTGAVLWSRSLGAPLTNVAAVAGCGDIDPLGITSTPVVDTRTNTVYVVGEVATGPSTVHHELEGFNAVTGALTVADDVDPTLPAGESRINLLQRASLALGNGRVYVGFGGNDGDCGNYHGWLVGVDETGAPNKVQFEATPTSEGGAIWEPGGPSIDASGNVYVTTGNSNPFPGGTSDPGVFAESVVKLSPALSVEASFKDPVASGDADLGTDSPTLIPGGEVFAVGKTDNGYVLRTSNLSLVATIHGLCGSDPDGGNAYDVATDTLFIPCRGGGIQEVHLATNTAGPRLSGENSGPIFVAGDVWASGYPGGTLTEWNAANGRVLQSFSVGSSVPTFASPSAALGLLLIGTTSGMTAFRGPGGLPANPPPPSPSACAPGPQTSAPGAPPPSGSYLLAASDGGVFTFGGFPFHGSAACEPLVRPVVGVTSNHRGGYWLVASDGGVFSFGAPFEGSAGGLPLKAPIVGMASTPDGLGYWLVASDGGVFTYGDARFHGSLGALRLNAPIVGIASTPDGGGYWLVARDGGVFAFGDARFAGSMGGQHLDKPVVGIAAGRSGYRLVASDGGIFDFGDAKFAGSLGGLHLNAPIVGMIPTASGAGYLMTASDGGVFVFGDARFDGSMGGTPLVRPVVGITGG